MECRLLKIRLISADQIRNVNYSSKMDVYANVSVFGDAYNQQFTTPVHKNGGTNPIWKHSPFTFKLEAAAINHLNLKIELVSDRTFTQTKIGKAVMTVGELLENSRQDLLPKLPQVTYNVLRPTETHSSDRLGFEGTVTFVYTIGDIFRDPLPVQPNAQNEIVVQQRGLQMPQPQDRYGYSTLLCDL